MRKASMSLFFLVLTSTGVAARSIPTRLRFIEDNYARALAEANHRKLPIFIDVWAPW